MYLTSDEEQMVWVCEIFTRKKRTTEIVSKGRKVLNIFPNLLQMQYTIWHRSKQLRVDIHLLLLHVQHNLQTPESTHL